MLLFDYVSPGYFQAMGTRLVAGRDFTWADVFGMRPMVMVSENFARQEWGSAAAAVGKRVRQFSSSPWEEVIGVAQDVREHGADADAPAMVYWPVLMPDPYTSQHEPYAVRPCASRFTATARGRRVSGADAAGGVERERRAAGGRLWGRCSRCTGSRWRGLRSRWRCWAIAGAMSLLLGIIGIYGVISYAVSQRTREIGIRLALGAQRSELRWMFVRSALVLTGVGVAIGLAAAAGLTQAMKSLLYGVSPTDPVTYASIAILLAVCAAVASYLPARRAAAVNPVEALRAE